MSPTRRVTRGMLRESNEVNVETKKLKKEKPHTKKEGKTKQKELPKNEVVEEPSSSFEIKFDENINLGGALKGRVDEFDSLKGWVDESRKLKKALSVYISGQPGTGKTATTKRVIESYGKSIRSCIVNCASVNTKPALLNAIFDSQKLDGRVCQENFEKQVKQFTTSLVLVLDEIDHLVSRSNSILYAAFQWPHTLSHKIIIIGIANSIDLTERLLPKLMLAEPPKRLVFEPYSKDSIVEILTDKMKNEETEIDNKAVELCARKVAAMSGDLRTALHIFKQTKHRVLDLDSNGVDGQPAQPKNSCREVLGVISSVYSSPLARARLPFQPRILLAVCLTLSSNKKASFNRDSLMNAYMKTCEAIRAPQMEEEELLAAFKTLEAQSFVRQLNGGKLVLQVDSATARSAISDNSMLDQIALLNL